MFTWDKPTGTHSIEKVLNPNGEKNAAVRLAVAMISFEKVILIETPEAIVDILEHLLWALKVE